MVGYKLRAEEWTTKLNGYKDSYDDYDEYDFKQFKASLEKIQETIVTSMKQMADGKGQLDTAKPIDTSIVIVPKVTLISLTSFIAICWIYYGIIYATNLASHDTIE